MTKHEWALWLAKRGLRVFPLHPGSKKAWINAWPEKATTDTATIDKWWKAAPEANIGVCTTGHVVVDVDTKNGKNGWTAFDALGVADEAAETLRVNTPSGGQHVYFFGPDFRGSVGSLGVGLDIRAHHNYVVGPGSVLDLSLDPGVGCNGPYTVASDLPIQPAPQALLSRLDRPTERNTSAPLVELDGTWALDRSKLHLISEAEPAIEGQGGDHQTLKVACRLKDFGVSEETAFDLMLEFYNERCEPPWEAEDLKEKVANAYRYGANVGGTENPEAWFKDVWLPSPDTHNASRLKWMRADNEALDTKRRWLIKNLIPIDGLGILSGPSQSGKTFLEIEAARCIATGKPFFGFIPKVTGGVIFIFAGSEGSRFKDRVRALGEGPLPISGVEVALGDKGAVELMVKEIRLEIAKMKADFGCDLRMIFVETLAASGLMAKENEVQACGHASEFEAAQVLQCRVHHHGVFL